MTQQPNIILSHQQIQNKIRRIAYQIYEVNFNEEEIILAGIAENGYILAQKLKNVLDSISDIDCKLCEVTMNKEFPLNTVATSMEEEAYKNKSVILIDDVLHSGATLIYGVKHFLNVSLKRFNTVVLVDRNHKKYPVKADYKGISLSTSLQEHVKVIFGSEDMALLK